MYSGFAAILCGHTSAARPAGHIYVPGHSLVCGSAVSFTTHARNPDLPPTRTSPRSIIRDTRVLIPSNRRGVTRACGCWPPVHPARTREEVYLGLARRFEHDHLAKRLISYSSLLGRDPQLLLSPRLTAFSRGMHVSVHVCSFAVLPWATLLSTVIVMHLHTLRCLCV